MTVGPVGGALPEAREELGAPDEEPSGPGSTERQALLDERAFLLRSLRDLEQERAAGDLDVADYEALRSRYASRAAAVLRALAEPGAGGGDAATPEPAAPSTASPATASSALAASTAPVRRRRRRWLVGGAVACFAVAAVVVVVGALGIGLPGNPVTGSLTLTHRQQVQRLLAQGEAALLQGDSVTALAAFEQALAIDPSQQEALSEAGWLQFAAGVRARNRTLVQDGQRDEQRAVAHAPGVAGPRFYLAAMLAQEGSTQHAVTEFEAALHDSPTVATVAAFASTIDKVFGQAHVPVPVSVGQAVAAEEAGGAHGTTPASGSAGS